MYLMEKRATTNVLIYSWNAQFVNVNYPLDPIGASTISFFVSSPKNYLDMWSGRIEFQIWNTLELSSKFGESICIIQWYDNVSARESNSILSFTLNVINYLRDFLLLSQCLHWTNEISTNFSLHNDWIIARLATKYSSSKQLE